MKTKFRNLYLKVRNYLYISKQENKLSAANPVFTHVTHCIGGNVGDTVLSQCVRNIFRQNAGISRWNIVTVNNPVTDRTIRQINSTSAVVIGGGGLFLPDTNKNPVSGWVWAVSSTQLKEITAPIIIYAVGYNYFRGQDNQEVFIRNLNQLIEQAGFIGLRNSGSIRKIKEIIRPDLRDKIVFQPCVTTIIRKLYQQLPPKTKTGKIAVNMAFDRIEMRFGVQKDIILNQIVKAIKAIASRGYAIVYAVHYEKDRDFIKYLKDAKVNFAVYDMSNGFPQKAINFYNQTDLVLGMRGHAQMIPFGLNCEIISLGSHDKLKWFLEDIDAMDWYVELTEQTDTLQKRIVDLFIKVHETESAQTQERLLSQQERLWKISCSNMSLITKTIECYEGK